MPTVAESFNRLPIDGAYALEFLVDPRIKLSLTLMQDPEKVPVGSTVASWDLQFNRIRVARVKLDQVGEHVQLESHRAFVPAIPEGKDGSLVQFILKFANGTIEVAAVDFTFAVIEEIPMAGGSL